VKTTQAKEYFMLQGLPGKKLITVILVFLVGILFVIGFFYRKIFELSDTSAQVSHSNLVLYRSEKLLSTLSQNEDAIKGFLLTNDAAYLSVLSRSENDINKQLEMLRVLTGDNPAQQKNLDTLSQFISKASQLSERLLAEKQRAGTAAASKLLTNPESKGLLEKVFSLIKQIKKGEDALLAERKEASREAVFSVNRQLRTLIVMAVFLLVLFLVLLVRFYISRMKQAADNKYASALLRNVQDAIISTDADFVIKSWNKGAEEIYGWKEEEAIGKFGPELLQTKFETNSSFFFIDNLKKNGYFRGEVTQTTKSGKQIFVQVNSSGLYDTKGNFIGAVAVNRDISGRKMLEKQLLELNSNLEEKILEKGSELRNVFERITDGFIAFDEDWQYTYVNKKAGEMLNCNPDDLIGHNIWELIPEVLSNDFHTYCADAMKTQEYRGFEVFYQPGQKWFECHVYPSREGLSVFIRDITEKKNAAEALMASESRFRALVEKSSEIIVMLDEAANKVYISPSSKKILGYRNVERIGKNIFDFIHPDDIGIFRKQFDKIIQAPGAAAEAQWRHKDIGGQWHWMEGVASNQLHDPAVHAVILNFHDITDRKKAEEELNEKNMELQRLSEYLQNIREKERKLVAREVHDELGQLVSALKMDVDWLMIRVPSSDELIKQRVAHANKIMAILLKSIRKIAADLRPSVLDDFGLAEALRWYCSDFEEVYNIQCHYESDVDDKKLNIKTATEIFRIVQESLLNVAQHANATSVTISLKEENEMITAVVHDNGSGFDVQRTGNTPGLVGLRERAASVKGTFTVISREGGGTKIIAVIPVFSASES